MRDQRVRGEIVLRDVGVELVFRPVRQRVELEPARHIAAVHFEARQSGAGGGLEALAPGDRCVELRHRAGQRLDLANLAAAVGIERPAQAIGVAFREADGIWFDDDQVSQAQARSKLVAICDGLGEMLVRFKKDHGNRGIDLRHHVKQNRAFRAEAGNHPDPSGKLFGNHRAQHLACLDPGEPRIEQCGVGLGETRSGIDPVDPAGGGASHAVLPRWARGHRQFFDKHQEMSRKRAPPPPGRSALAGQSCRTRSGACG